LSLNELIDEIVEESKIHIEKGNVATYIPELGKMDKNIIGLSITDFQGNIYNAGRTDVKFTLQSISKPIVLLLALLENGEEVFNKVGMEPTGDPFNSMVRLETFDTGKPLNPMINAGAITVASMIKGENLMKKTNKVLNMVRLLSGNDGIKINDKVFQSELRTGNRNRAIAYFLKDNGIIEGSVDDALALYFKQCSIEVTTQDLANIAMVLANDGIDFKTNTRLIPSHYANLVKSLMLTCGLYDHSGEFASTVGFPAKSGVSGGILGVVPRKLGIGVIGPALDIKGNSIAGVRVLEKLSDVLDLNIFK
jgi:glutaminase